MDARSKKNRHVWFLIKQLGQQMRNVEAAEQIARNIARDTCGTEHISALDVVQLEIVIRNVQSRLRRASAPLGSPTPAPHRTPAGATGLLTPKQRAMIDALFRQIGWRNPEQQTGLYQRILGHDHPRTTKDGTQVLRALLAIKAHAQSET